MYQVVATSGDELWKKDLKIAHNNNLRPLFAIIKTAILEKDTQLFNEITEDLSNNVAIYRQKILDTKANKRHIQIEYPYSLLNVVYELAQDCFEKEDIAIQQQVSAIVNTIIFYDKSNNNWDCQKYGISSDTLKLLWIIAIDATNRKRYEYLKLYWAVVFEYTKNTFHAPVVTRDHLPTGHERYELTDSDKEERALIANVHFMWMAYLYDRQEYNLLKDVLEYYNGYRDVEELNFLSIETALLNYNAEILLKRKNITIEKLIHDFHYYTTNSTSEIRKQQMILANFVSFIVNIYYNRWKSVPIMPPNISMNESIASTNIERSLQHQKAIPNVDFDLVTISERMDDDKVDAFMSGLVPRTEPQEVEFLRKCKIGEAHLYHLFRYTKSNLSSEIGLNKVAWVNKISSDDLEWNIYNTEISTEINVSRGRMVYCGGEYTLYQEASSLSCGFLISLNEQVAKAYYSSINVPQEDITIDLLTQELNQMSHDKRYFLFYTNEAQLSVLKALHFEPIGERNYLYRGDFSIKCIPIHEDEYSTRIANQLWIMPKEEQPVLHFVDVDYGEGWKSIHEFANSTIKSRDLLHRKFEQAPIFVHMRDNNIEENNPLVTITLKSKIEIHGLEQPHVRVFSLANINNPIEGSIQVIEKGDCLLKIFEWILKVLHLFINFIKKIIRIIN